MATVTGSVAHFTTVDSAPDTTFFVTFMDDANAFPEYRGIKTGLVAALGDATGGRVLDVGCGTGDDARELAALGGRVVGLDLSEAMVAEARRRGAGSALPTEFVAGDIRQLDFEDGSFDGVYAKLVLMHCEDIEASLDELLRVLRPGGRIAVFDLDFEMVTVDHPDLRRTRTILNGLADSIRTRWSGRQLKRRLLARGMTDVTIEAHTVLMPFDFCRRMVAGPVSAAWTAGRVNLSLEELDTWWQDLAVADREGRFFASFTGFVVGATR